MENLAHSFWRKLRKLTTGDTSVEVPENLVNQALTIFQRTPAKAAFLFQLRPLALGLVRGETDINRTVYGLEDDTWVTMEQAAYAEGVTLQGSIQGFPGTHVQIFGDEFFADTKVTSGTFEFTRLPKGRYNLSFSHDKEPYWIVDLELRGEAKK